MGNRIDEIKGLKKKHIDMLIKVENVKSYEECLHIKIDENDTSKICKNCREEKYKKNAVLKK